MTTRSKKVDQHLVNALKALEEMPSPLSKNPSEMTRKVNGLLLERIAELEQDNASMLETLKRCYTELDKMRLSPEAQAVYIKARDLVKAIEEK